MPARGISCTTTIVAQIEDSYLGPLVELGDKRIAAELARRYKTATAIRMRRKYASACHDLGDGEPLKAYARDVEKGSLELPDNDQPNTNENDQPGNVELGGIVASLVHAATAECDRALYALAAPDHPYHALAVQRVLSAGRALFRRGQRMAGAPVLPGDSPRPARRYDADRRHLENRREFSGSGPATMVLPAGRSPSISPIRRLAVSRPRNASATKWP